MCLRDRQTDRQTGRRAGREAGRQRKRERKTHVMGGNSSNKNETSKN